MLIEVHWSHFQDKMSCEQLRLWFSRLSLFSVKISANLELINKVATKWGFGQLSPDLLTNLPPVVRAWAGHSALLLTEYYNYTLWWLEAMFCKSWQCDVRQQGCSVHYNACQPYIQIGSCWMCITHLHRSMVWMRHESAVWCHVTPNRSPVCRYASWWRMMCSGSMHSLHPAWGHPNVKHSSH